MQGANKKETFENDRAQNSEGNIINASVTIDPNQHYHEIELGASGITITIPSAASGYGKYLFKTTVAGGGAPTFACPDAGLTTFSAIDPSAACDAVGDWWCVEYHMGRFMTRVGEFQA